MKTTLVYLFLFAAVVLMVSCEKQTSPEAIMVQNPYTYGDQYYGNLREYKKSDHQICYGWFADYSQTFSYGLHFLGLPDSLDICSLWGGVPSKLENDTLGGYNPQAYDEMQFIRKNKGTKLVAPFIVRMSKDNSRYKGWYSLDTNGIKQFGDYLLRYVQEYDIDGLDIDYEPEGDFLTGTNFTYFIKYLGQFIGPASKNPDKLLVVDFYGTIPSAETEPYVNYFVKQAYAAGSATTLQNGYNSISSWCPPAKYVVTENIGDYWQNGGVVFTEVDGNKLTSEGTQMYSLEGMARWNPTQGKKGGFGAFYMQRDYNLDPPYKNIRRCIQIINPAVR